MASKINTYGMTALVTGASSGIGLEFCRQLASKGINLLMVSNQKDALEYEAETLRKTYKIIVNALCLDLTKRESLDAIFDFIDSQGIDIDILINNAGIFSFNFLTDTAEDKIDAFIDLHMRTLTVLATRCAKRMKAKRKGYILNMSSMSCWMPMPGLAMYAATKAYIRVMSRSLHYELRDYGVKVMVACPGGISTSLFGLPDNLMRLALRLRAVDTPEKFVSKAIKRMLQGKMQYINGMFNRLSIFGIGITPTCIRMLIKRKMLDKNIIRP